MSEEGFSIAAAQLSGNFCETLFFGMYLVTCSFCARTLLLTGRGPDERWLRPREIRWIMAIVALVLFVLCTFDVAIGLLHNFHAFVESKDPERELLNLGDWINVTRSSTQAAAMVIGDFVLIYRCWIVYGRRWLIVAPSIILYLAGIAMAVMFIEAEKNPSTVKTTSLTTSPVLRWGLAFFAITAFQNTLTTSILIWRIWRVERDSGRYLSQTEPTGVRRPRHLRKVMLVIAESGAAYTMMVLITFFTSLSGSNALYPTSDMTLQSTGIAFNVILVCSSARRDRQFTQFDINERTITDSQTTTRSTTNMTLGSINFPPKRSGVTQEVDLKTIRTTKSADGPSPQSDVYPGGIIVTKSVHKT